MVLEVVPINRWNVPNPHAGVTQQSAHGAAFRLRVSVREMEAAVGAAPRSPLAARKPFDSGRDPRGDPGALYREAAACGQAGLYRFVNVPFVNVGAK